MTDTTSGAGTDFPSGEPEFKILVGFVLLNLQFSV